MNKEIRWQQRFENFEKSFLLLEETLQIQDLSKVERGGLVQFFEMSFELASKTLKDYLELEGFVVNTPRETLRQAFQIEIIKDGHTWMDALKDRNLMTHTYDEETSMQVEKLVREKYYPMLKQFYTDLKNKI